jgi:hypothetical protein
VLRVHIEEKPVPHRQPIYDLGAHGVEPKHGVSAIAVMVHQMLIDGARAGRLGPL